MNRFRLVTPCLLIALFTLTPIAAEFHVAPTGNDGAAGDAGHPFATVSRALDAARTASGGDVIFIHRGVYPITESLRITGGDPVTLRGMSGARLIGGRVITGFKPIDNNDALQRLPEEARGAVMQCDLRAQGVDDFGELKVRGFGRPEEHAALEVFFNGKPLTLAQWPNQGWAPITGAPEGKDGGVFTYEGDRPARWSKASDVWLHGYWTQDWADSYVKVNHFDLDAKAIYTEPPHGVYGYTKGQRWMALNLLEELDQPGEWYLDRDAGMLYLWPPETMKDAEVIVSMLDDPIVSIEGANGARIERLTLEACRGTAVTIRDSKNVRVAGCVIRNTGQKGVAVSGGEECQVVSCDVYETGEGGISISGGDRASLTPAHHAAINNDIFRYGRWVQTYQPAISLHGVGNRMAHNRIHDSPHAGVLFGGNDHVLELNEVYNLCQQTGDVGAFYIGRDWTMRGHIVRGNYFHDISGPYKYASNSVYLDDAASGVTIIGNIFDHADVGAFIGGGRDNLVENNLMVDCEPAVHVDGRGIGWAAKYIVKGGEWHMYDKLSAMNFDQPPYSERYPKLATILDGDPAFPAGNRVALNISYGGKWLELQNIKESDVDFENNFVFESSDGIEWRKDHYQLPKDHPALAAGFKPIDFDEIGLQKDEWRKSIPAR